MKKYFEQNRKIKINEFYDADNAGKENEKPPNKIDPKKVEAAERIVLIRLVQVKKFEFKLLLQDYENIELDELRRAVKNRDAESFSKLFGFFNGAGTILKREIFMEKNLFRNEQELRKIQEKRLGKDSE